MAGAICVLALSVVGLSADSSEPGPAGQSAEHRYSEAVLAAAARQAAPTAEEPGTAADGNFPPGPGLRYSFWVDATSRVKKLNSEISFPRGQFDVVVPIGQPPNPMRGNLTLPNAEGYFVTFGFMPVTNTVEMVPDGVSEGLMTVGFQPVPHAEVDLTLKLFLALSDVRVDGEPLDVGPNCRTAEPLVIKIKDKVNLRPEDGATTTNSTFEIPPFTGCGATEDLDPLLTGMISGPGNELSSTLSVRCSPASTPC
ncbi:hypothetical protein [Amycolatopsis aidingensis]|uniref:hypothetical protein n=1 Tax=Amycolatopsis aidingensis TaxID=2842453 RepID=UPI001C0B6CBB|nr:hypothetical protein [Amycolatopsis aidingensis]